MLREQLSLFIATELPPPLKWAGGKRWLLPTLTQLYKPHSRRRLVEPFVGGMAATLGIQPNAALLNDVNPHLINFYRWLQSGLRISLHMENDRDLFYNYREQFNTLVRTGKANSREAGELFYYLNRTCFNGLCRFNSRGEFNVPFGKYKNIKYKHDFSAYTTTLSGYDFSVGDFTKLCLDANDFIYADPPYDVQFTTYSAGGFSWEDQLRLVEWLALQPGAVVASNQATERILDLYSSYRFDIKIIQAPRMISCTGDRSPALEMLATKGV